MTLLKNTLFLPPLCRCLSNSPPTTVSKSIYFSKITDIFTNLAIEDWFYKNVNFANHHVLMLWQNQPCVVIGRHQNPWIECNFSLLPNIAGGVHLARRNSGGGTVYHDLGNLNLTFFTGRKEYSRRTNLELISRALETSFGIHSHITPREDLCIRENKISGTASKLGRTSAYHHCTLLVDANKENLSLALKNDLAKSVKTNASRSVKSTIMNLSEVVNGITVEEVMKAITFEFDGNFKDPAASHFENSFLKRVKVIEDVNDIDFPGIEDIRRQYVSSEWRYSKTPKFEIAYSVFDDLNNLQAILKVESGQVINAGLKCDDKDNQNLSELSSFSELFAVFRGKMFCKEVLDDFQLVVGGLKHSDKCRTIMLNK